MADLPEWAEEWVRGKCGCGARLCRAACYCGGHVVCSASGWDTEKCQLPDERPSATAATPRQRWGTCCPNDPECEHSFMDDEELARYLDTPLAVPSPNAARPSVDTTEGDAS